MTDSTPFGTALRRLRQAVSFFLQSLWFKSDATRREEGWEYAMHELHMGRDPEELHSEAENGNGFERGNPFDRGIKDALAEWEDPGEHEDMTGA